MDRSFDEIRADVLSLDNDRLRELVDEAEAKLATRLSNSDYDEAAERLGKYDRGEMKATSAEQSVAAARAFLSKPSERKR